MAQGYMMPNALKLPETVDETALEVVRTFVSATGGGPLYDRLAVFPWIVAASSGTIAAGVIKGLLEEFGPLMPKVIVHLGYDRSEEELRRYICKLVGLDPLTSGTWMRVVNEGYAYSDTAKAGPVPPWACNEYYDLKAFRWWMVEGRKEYGSNAVMWNIG